MTFFTATLRGRLLIIFLVLMALPALLVGGFVYVNAYQTARTQALAQLRWIVDLKTSSINNWLNECSNDARLIAGSISNQDLLPDLVVPSLDRNRRAALTSRLTIALKSVLVTRAGDAVIAIANTDGRVVASTDLTQVGMDRAGDPVVISALQSDTASHNSSIHRQSDGSLVMDFGHALHQVGTQLKEADRKVSGVLILRVRMDDGLYPLLPAWIGISSTREIFFVPLNSEVANPIELPTSSSEGILATTDHRGVPVLAAYSTIAKVDWGIVAKQDSAEVYAALNKRTRQWIVLVASLLSIALGMAYFLIGKLTQPLTGLLAVVQPQVVKNLNQGQSISHGDEIDQLAAAFQCVQDTVLTREKDLETQSLQLAALSRLTYAVNSTLDIQAAFDAFMQEVKTLLPLDRASVGLVDEQSGGLRIVAASGLAANLIGQNLRMRGSDNAHASEAIACRRTVIIDDLERELRSPMDRQLLQQGIRSALILPLISDGKVIGVLNLGTRVVNAYLSENVLLAEQIATQMATAVAKASLYERERERARQLATLNTIAMRSMAILQVNELLQQVVSTTREGFDFSVTTIALIEGDALIIKASACQDCDPCLDIGTRIPLTTFKDLSPTELSVTSEVSLPLCSAVQFLGVLTVKRSHEHPFEPADVSTLQLLANLIVVALGNANLHEQVLRESITDGLTGLNNRRYLDIFLKRELASCVRYHHDLAVLMLDVDHFKLYNDTHGHAAGDIVLKQIAGILAGVVREADLVARYGGEEFTVVMPASGLQEARIVAEKIRLSVESFEFENGLVTVSIGVAAWNPEQSLFDMLASADQALYRAKRQGRNQVAG